MKTNNILTAAVQTTIMDACQSISRSADEFKAGCTIGDEWPNAGDKAFYDAELRLLERLTALLAHPGAQQRTGTAEIKDGRVCSYTFEQTDIPDGSYWLYATPHPSQPAASEAARDAKDATRYRFIKSQMRVGAVQTQLPLYRTLHWIGYEDCSDVRDADEAIDTEIERLDRAEGE